MKHLKYSAAAFVLAMAASFTSVGGVRERSGIYGWRTRAVAWLKLIWSASFYLLPDSTVRARGMVDSAWA